MSARILIEMPFRFNDFTSSGSFSICIQYPEHNTQWMYIRDEPPWKSIQISPFVAAHVEEITNIIYLFIGPISINVHPHTYIYLHHVYSLIIITTVLIRWIWAITLNGNRRICPDLKIIYRQSRPPALPFVRNSGTTKITKQTMECHRLRPSTAFANLFISLNFPSDTRASADFQSITIDNIRILPTNPIQYWQMYIRMYVYEGISWLNHRSLVR